MAAAARTAYLPDLDILVRWQASLVMSEIRGTLGATECGVHCALVRDIFGNPFRPPPRIDAAWLAGNDGTVKRLAEAAYEHRSLPDGTLDLARLAVLADALEDAGCTDAELLGHLRTKGPHVRGCFAVDAVLGKS